MKWLNSLDELLYEVMSWLLFFPLTLWRATARPFWTMREAERQLGLAADEQYATVLSPPLFLALGLLLAHALATALGETDKIIANTHGLAGLVSDDASALILRVLIFASFPLFLGSRSVAARRQRLDRMTLRLPFYQQCYPAAVFALGVSIGVSLATAANSALMIAGTTLIWCAVLNYAAVEIGWFIKNLGLRPTHAIVTVAIGLLESTALVLLVGFLFTR